MQCFICSSTDLGKHSTTLALIYLTDKTRTILQYASGIYLDLKKAFDTVDHGILLSKLETYSFRGYVNDFIRSYLSNRKQFTIINGYCPSQRGINVGVPQGSVMGPLFFLLDINDIPKYIDGADITLFADDTSVLSNESLDTLKEKAEKCLKSLGEWFTGNKLTLNTEIKSLFITLRYNK